MTEMGPDLKPGQLFQTHAISLGSKAYRDNDKLVRFFSLDLGIVSTIALNAQQSLKRFGAAIEPGTHSMLQLKVPRDLNSTQSPLFRLDKADLRSQFPHLRADFASIESLSFILRLVTDNYPELHPDGALFKTLGRVLRDSSVVNFSKYAGWVRAYFWSWFTQHLGYGDLLHSWKAQEWDVPEEFWEAWDASICESEDVLVREFFESFFSSALPQVSTEAEVSLYRSWLELSGIHWKFFETWIKSRP